MFNVLTLHRNNGNSRLLYHNLNYLFNLYFNYLLQEKVIDDVITSNIMLQFIIQKKIFHIAVSLHSNRSSLDDVNRWTITVLCGGWKAYSKEML